MPRRKKPKRKTTKRKPTKRKPKAKAVSGELVDAAADSPLAAPSAAPDVADTFTSVVNGIASKDIQGLVKSVLTDATTAEEVGARTAAANAFTRMIKICYEISKPQASPVKVNVNVAADESLQDTIARMRAEGRISK